jgi:predicted ABC-type ATPase
MSSKSFEEYEQDVRRYGSTWFHDDEPALEVLERAPEIRRQVFRLAAGRETIGTEALYEVGKRWVHPRSDLHAELVARALAGDPSALDEAASRAPGTVRLPHAVLLLGLPGSGKSSVLRPIARELLSRVSPTSGIIVDADEVRSLIPEYAKGLGSVVVQPETTYIANRLLIDEATRRRCNIVLDKVGEPEMVLDAVAHLEHAGWTVWCLCAQIDVEVALERSRRRAIETGRYVKPEYIRRVGDDPLRAYEALRESRSSIAGRALLDTDVELGARPTVVDADPTTLFGEPGDLVTLWPDPVPPDPARSSGPEGQDP